MNHSFDVDIAKKYGIEEAILLQNLYFWIEKNKANNKHFYNDTYWTYNSKKAFADLFPYMTPRKIDYTLKNLIDNGLIITGNFNANATDRTLWYSLTKMGYCILQNCEMENTKLLNDIDSNNNINNINTNNKPNINNVNNKKKKEKIVIENLEERLQVIYDYWNTKGIIKHHIGLTKELKEAYTKAIIKWELNDDTIKEAIDHYDTMLKDVKSGFTYLWNLAEFLSRENGARTFTSESSRWNNYQCSKNKPYVVKQNNGMVEYTINPNASYHNRGDNDF